MGFMGTWGLYKHSSNQNLPIFIFTWTHKMTFSYLNYNPSNCDWKFSSSGEEMFDEMNKNVCIFFQCAFIAFNFEEVPNDNEDEGIK